jgi:hypothetical protein
MESPKKPSGLVAAHGGKLLALLVFACAALTGLAAEFFVRAHYMPPSDRIRGAEALWRGYGNSFLAISSTTNGCVWEDTLVAHPYLGWVNAKVGPCQQGETNNIGMPDPRVYPFERDPAYFTVVLVGGSVASLMVASGPNWLERALAERFVSPNGKPFRVLSGANGAWSYPSQINFLSLYGDSADAVVALDGFNELKPTLTPLFSPNSDVFLYAARPVEMGWTYDAFLTLQYARRFVLSVPLLRHSYLGYLAFRRGMEKARAHFEARKEDVLEQYFDFPADWDARRKASWNQRKYGTYIRQLKATAAALGIRYVHFLQPVPQIGKPLTPEERAYVDYYFDREGFLREFLAPSEELRRKGFLTFSLLDVFRDEPGTVYADAVHFRVDGDGGSRGYALVSAAMAETIGKAWRLRRRHSAHE